MLGLPAHRLDDEGVADRQARLQMIGHAVAEAAERATCRAADSPDNCRKVWPGEPLDLAVLLVVQAYSESRLAKNVHEGKCRPYECDPIKVAYTGKVIHRARSLWQIHHISPIEDEWDEMEGADLDSTKAAAWAAAKLLSRGYRSCGTFSGAISRYAGINSCNWSEAKRRGQLFEHLRARARRTEAQGISRRAEQTAASL